MYINKDIDFIIYTYDDFNTIYVSLKMQFYYYNIIFCFNNLKSHKNKNNVLLTLYVNKL